MLALVWLTLTLIVLCTGWGCRRAVTREAARAAETHGVISGRIRGPERSTPLDGRIVELVNLTTLERQRVATNESGSFVFEARPGDYRIELTLLEGEALVREPGVIHLNRTNVDTEADIVIGNGRVSRPRPAYKVDDGLGSPVA